MNLKTITPFLLLTVLLAGCSSTAQLLNNIHIGMTKDQVVAILGAPDSTSAQANIEYLTYYLYVDSDRYRSDQPYSVRLVDGKVESYGRFHQLFDIINRPVAGSTVTAPLWARQPYPDLVSQIQRLRALKESGALTEEEFQKAKAKLLADTN